MILRQRGTPLDKSWPLFASLVIATALVWAQFRSFDLLDGGYYFLLYQNPSDNRAGHTHFEYLARPLWLICGQNIIAFRVACLGLVSLVAVFFWYRCMRLLPGMLHPMAAGLALWLAAMASLCWVPVSLTYNSFATVFAMLGLAILIPFLRYVSDRDARPAWRWCRVVAISGLVAGLVLVKPPAALAFVAGCWFLLFFDAQTTGRT
jgi:hypothetical protein